MSAGKIKIPVWADFIWYANPCDLRSKRRRFFVEAPIGENGKPSFTPQDVLAAAPPFSCDGSILGKTDAERADILIRPFSFAGAPWKTFGEDVFECMLLCQAVYDGGDGKGVRAMDSIEGAKQVHATENARALNLLVGFEQQWSLKGTESRSDRAESYCSFGSSEVRDLAEAHAKACERAGVNLLGYHAGTSEHQFEFQLPLSPSFSSAIQLTFARFVLCSLAAQRGLGVSFDPVHGSTLQALHANVSTPDLSDAAMEKLEKEYLPLVAADHGQHLAISGEGNADRLGEERAMQFTVGVGSVRSSIRVPLMQFQLNAGGWQDRRFGANANPFQVIGALSITLATEKKDETTDRVHVVDID